jgi:hypothetical protein
MNLAPKKNIQLFSMLIKKPKPTKKQKTVEFHALSQVTFPRSVFFFELLLNISLYIINNHNN